MRFTVCGSSDTGRVKKINQDAFLIKHILFGTDEIVLLVLCDGMGGFSEGEIASTSVVKTFLEWFDLKYSSNISSYSGEKLFKEWRHLIDSINYAIFNYGKKNKIQLGTTATVMLIKNMTYYIANIGDCRAYELTDTIRQLTVDHSVVEREIQAGRLTREEARFDNRRNQILRSIGAEKKANPDYFTGKIVSNGVYVLCCDGVRNKVYDDELFYFFHPDIMTTEYNMQNNIQYIFFLNKLREENDNMSVLVLKVNEETLTFCENKNTLIIEKEQMVVNSEKVIEIN